MISALKKLALFILVIAVLVPASSPAFAKSNTKTVYVLTKIYTDKRSKSNITQTFSYNKNGLLKSSTLGSIVKGEYTYNRKNQITRYRESMNQWTTNDYSYNKKGQIIKNVCTYRNLKSNKLETKGFVSTYKYNKDGKLISENAKKGKKANTYKYTYGKNGFPSKFTENTEYGKKTTTYTYDKKNNIKTMETKSSDGTFSYNYSNKYKSGRCDSQTVTETYDGDSYSIKYFYAYKKMTVSKSLADQIEAQQWSLLNNNLNNAIPKNWYDRM